MQISYEQQQTLEGRRWELKLRPQPTKHKCTRNNEGTLKINLKNNSSKDLKRRIISSRSYSGGSLYILFVLLYGGWSFFVSRKCESNKQRRFQHET